MFSNGCYAKVWDIKEGQTSTGKNTKTIRISISRKKTDTDYEQVFSGYVQLYGDALNKPVAKNDTIQLEKVGVTNNYDKEKGVTYVNYFCFDFRTQDELNAARAASGAIPVENQPDRPTTGNGAVSAPEPKENPASPVTDDGSSDDGFMNIPDGIEDELPFN